ncbi:MAG: chorismate mutase [Bacteroidetes bacterium]|nr:chorismate mutase [Bacteroidota bacterium]
MERQEKEIAGWRKRIDKIDRSIVQQLNKRAFCVNKIGLAKKQIGINVYSPKRENQVLRNVTDNNKGPFSNRAVREIFSSIMLESRKFEHVKQKKKTQNKRK